MSKIEEKKRGAPLGNQNARLGKHGRRSIGLSGPTLDLIYDALALEGNYNPSSADIKHAVYYAIRQVYGRKIEHEQAIIL